MIAKMAEVEMVIYVPNAIENNVETIIEITTIKTENEKSSCGK
jgi:hypothetical protein